MPGCWCFEKYKSPAPIKQPDAIACALVSPEGLSAEQVAPDSLCCLVKVEELDLPAVALHLVIDQLDKLGVPDPAVGMEDQAEGSFLDGIDVDGCLQVIHRDGVVDPVQFLGLPVARHSAGKLPAELSDDVGVGVVFDGVDIGFKGDVLAELFLVVFIDQEPARQLGVVRRWDVADGSCLLYTSPSPRDATLSRMPSSA